MGLNQWEGYDFQREIETYFQKNEPRLPPNVTPLMHITDICVESLVGWSVGLPNQMTLVDLGLITTEHNSRDQLTEKGRAFVWFRYRDIRAPLDNPSTG